MNQLAFQKFKKTLVELKEDSPKETAEFKKLSPKMKAAILDIYSMINKASDPIISKIEGIIKVASRKHGVSTYDIEDYFDNELIK